MSGFRSQFGKPVGWLGHLAGWIMANRPSNRIRNDWAVSLLDLRPTDRVLEIGFGPGLALAALCDRAARGFVAGVDHSDVMVRQARRRIARCLAAGRADVRLASVAELPDFGAPFDRILTVNSLMFWPDPFARLCDIRDRLAPNGTFTAVHQPRTPRATAETANSAASRMASLFEQAGFTHVAIQTMPLSPPVVAVTGRRPARPAAQKG